MRTCLFTLCLCWWAAVAVAADEPQKYALLIGVTKYDHAEMNRTQLEFPEADAKALGELLKSAGYQVDYLLGKDANQAAIRQKLNGLNRQGNAEGVVVLGLFGHGVEIESRDDQEKLITDGCFCPFDTEVRNIMDSQGRAILGDNGKPLQEPDPPTLVKLAEVLTVLNVAKAGNRVVFADCCRVVPNKTRGRFASFGSSFKAQDLPENTAVLFGCSPNEQAFEHEDWGHGAFTKCLLEELRDLSASGDVTTGILADRLKKKVPKLVASISARNRQTPKPFSTDSIDLQLTLKSVMPLVAPFTATQAKAAQEAWAKSFGQKVVETNSIDMRLVLIPAGEFQMGSPDSDQHADDEEKPQHWVKITKALFRSGAGTWKTCST